LHEPSQRGLLYKRREKGGNWLLSPTKRRSQEPPACPAYEKLFLLRAKNARRKGKGGRHPATKKRLAFIVLVISLGSHGKKEKAILRPPREGRRKRNRVLLRNRGKKDPNRPHGGGRKGDVPHLWTSQIPRADHPILVQEEKKGREEGEGKLLTCERRSRRRRPVPRPTTMIRGKRREIPLNPRTEKESQRRAQVTPSQSVKYSFPHAMEKTRGKKNDRQPSGRAPVRTA